MNGIIRRRLAAMLGDVHQHGIAYEVARILSAPARRGLVRLDVENRENLPPEGAAIVVANHLSFLDSVLLMFALRRPVAVLGKAEYTERWITRWLFCGSGMIPIRRQNPSDVVPAFAQVNQVLGRGQVVALFPEGTRSRDGLLHRGHSGAAHLALTSDVPLVPVGIVGTDRILPSGAKLVRPFRRATIRVGRPVRPSELGLTTSTRRTRRQLTDRIMGDIRRLCHQEYVDVYAPLPAAHQHR